MTNPSNTEIRAWLERAKTQPITAGLALEMLPIMEDLLNQVEVKWTKITDDRNALPKDNEKVLVWYRKLGIGKFKLGVGKWVDIKSYEKYNVSYWRPLCSFDHPPEQPND